ncbi:MAG TPA: hypothetical protein VN660_05945 [Steroidobacteraceae bacterium]|nr:hypothetical protein [Steroidobacteraceae bacterium]
MKRMLIGALATTLFSLSVSQAQDAHHMADMKNVPGMQGMQGAHQMQGTVDALDSKTGVMEVHADGMTLRLHFPPLSLADVKVGDKIEVALSFRKLSH